MYKTLNNKKCTQFKISHTLKTDVFQLLDNKNVRKLFPNYETFFLDQAIIKMLENCFLIMKRFSWIKLIQVLIHLKYWYYNSPSQDLLCLLHHLFNTISSCSSLVFPFCPTQFDHTPQVLDMPNHMSSQATQIYSQVIYRS